MKSERPWLSVADQSPTDGVLVETKIHDANGERNVAELRRSGRLWFIPGGMYVYYTPTHWRPLEKP